jgi:hypothetical protein
MLTMPTSLPSSIIGRWRILASVIFAIAASTRSEGRQPTQLDPGDRGERRHPGIGPAAHQHFGHADADCVGFNQHFVVAGNGGAMSVYSRASGPPGHRKRIAFMAANYCRPVPPAIVPRRVELGSDRSLLDFRCFPNLTFPHPVNQAEFRPRRSAV